MRAQAIHFAAALCPSATMWLMVDLDQWYSSAHELAYIVRKVFIILPRFDHRSIGDGFGFEVAKKRRVK